MGSVGRVRCVQTAAPPGRQAARAVQGPAAVKMQRCEEADSPTRKVCPCRWASSTASARFRSSCACLVFVALVGMKPRIG
eukprot:scaffold7147_cov130-Isochrysis_galbana.AAC.7